MANRLRTGRTDCDKRGNARDRAARRNWLLSAAAGWGGNGESAPCALRLGQTCEGFVNYVTMHVDRIVPGALGGRYVRTNIRPACAPCNISAGHDTRAEMSSVRG